MNKNIHKLGMSKVLDDKIFIKYFKKLDLGKLLVNANNWNKIKVCQNMGSVR